VSDLNLKVGDKVRLTIEAEISGVDFDGEISFEGNGGVGGSFYPEDLEEGVLEKIVPPFKAGDLVGAGGSRYLLLESLEDGRFKYLSLQTHGIYHAEFERENYKLVASNCLGGAA
jgi:hypothetical protein